MENTTLKFDTLPESGVLTILEGAAATPLPLRDPVKIDIAGDINTVQSFIAGRVNAEDAQYQNIDTDLAIVYIDKDAGTIELQLNPEDHFGGKVKGTLAYSKELLGFRINTETTFTREDLVKLIKFRRLFFENSEKHRELIAAFERFQAKVDTDIVSASDNRGNKDMQLKKLITSSLPLDFILQIPVFSGMKQEKFRVEICYDVTDKGARFWLESVELHEIIEERKTEIFDNMVNDWKDFVIIYK